MSSSPTSIDMEAGRVTDNYEGNPFPQQLSCGSAETLQSIALGTSASVEQKAEHHCIVMPPSPIALSIAAERDTIPLRIGEATQGGRQRWCAAIALGMLILAAAGVTLAFILPRMFPSVTPEDARNSQKRMEDFHRSEASSDRSPYLPNADGSGSTTDSVNIFKSSSLPVEEVSHTPQEFLPTTPPTGKDRTAEDSLTKGLPSVVVSSAALEDVGSAPLDAQWLLGGVDPVALHFIDEDAPAPRGDKLRYRLKVDTFWVAFATESNLHSFWLDPERYMPAFGGWDVWMLCTHHVLSAPAEGASVRLVRSAEKGGVYLFHGHGDKRAFAADPSACLRVANALWEAEGGNTRGRPNISRD